jgi:hypothetical protein
VSTPALEFTVRTRCDGKTGGLDWAGIDLDAHLGDPMRAEIMGKNAAACCQVVSRGVV